MKKILTSFLMLSVCAAAFAQDGLTDAQKAALDAANSVNNAAAPTAAAPKPNYWKLGISFDLGFNQVALSQWADGGYATIGLAAAVDGKANYAKDLMKWDNRMQLNYGFVWSADKKNLVQSSNDRIYLESKWAYSMSEKSKWAYSAGLDFRTQFADVRDNYRQENPLDADSKWIGDLKSSIFSPAYINLALGMDWTPTNWFNMSISPLTGGVVIVANDELRSKYGMAVKGQKTVYDEFNIPSVVDVYHASRWTLGTQIKANAKVAVNDWFVYETQLVALADYLRMDAKKYPDHDWYRINWDNKISFNVAKYFKIGLSTWLIYDPVVVYVDKKTNTSKKGPLQFKEALSINFTYTIASKK